MLSPALQLNTNRQYFPWFQTSFMTCRNQGESIVTTGFPHLSTWAAPIHSPTISTDCHTSARHHYQVPDTPTPSLKYAIDAPSALLSIRHMSIMPYQKWQYDSLRSPNIMRHEYCFRVMYALLERKVDYSQDIAPPPQSMTIMDPYRGHTPPYHFRRISNHFIPPSYRHSNQSSRIPGAFDDQHGAQGDALLRVFPSSSGTGHIHSPTYLPCSSELTNHLSNVSQLLIRLRIFRENHQINQQNPPPEACALHQHQLRSLPEHSHI